MVKIRFLPRLGQRRTLKLPVTPTHQQNVNGKIMQPISAFSTPSSSASNKPPNILTTIMGQWGEWQLRSVIFIYLCKIPSAWFMACVIFTAPLALPGEYYCAPPADVAIGNTSDWISFSHPQTELFDGGLSIDFCHVYKNAINHAGQYFNYTVKESWAAAKADDGMVIPCKAFAHASPFNSLVTQFDLVCSRTILVALTQFFHLFGILLGGIAAKKFMNTISPKRTMLVGMLLLIVCGIITGTVNSFFLHTIFRMFAAMCCALMFIPGQAIFTDITGGVYRTTTLCMYDNFWSIGVIVLPGVSLLASNWTQIYWLISLPLVIYILIWHFIPDSPTWHCQHGNYVEVRKILEQAVSMNGTVKIMPEDLEDQIKAQAEATVYEPPMLWADIFEGKPETLQHMIAAHLAWACFVINFMGMTLNIRAFGRDYLTVNTIVVGFSEIVGVFVAYLMMMRCRRKWLYNGVFNIISCAIAFMGFLYPDCQVGPLRVTTLMIVAMIAKMATSSGQAMLLACTSEIVTPEKVKPAMYSCVVFSRTFLLLAPFICVLNVIHTVMPLAVFGLINLAGGICLCFIDTPHSPTFAVAPTVSDDTESADKVYTLEADPNWASEEPSTSWSMRRGLGYAEYENRGFDEAPKSYCTRL